MNRKRTRFAIPALRWTLGIVVFLKSLQVAFSSAANSYFARIGLPQWVRLALAGCEMMAAVLFVVPAGSAIGSYLLLITFVAAALLHLLHGDLDIGGLAVYGMAVIVCMNYRALKKSEVNHD